ncbi:MAG: NADPH-quinone oxidoreductase, partial [Acidobacteria bacterium]
MLNYFREIYYGMVTVAISMWMTLCHLFTPSVTLQYPTVKWNLPDR